MNKTLTVIRPGESHDDYSGVLKHSDAERIGLADKLLRDLWIPAHGKLEAEDRRDEVSSFDRKGCFRSCG